MAFFLTGALLGAAAASSSADRRYYNNQQNMYMQSQALQAQAEARALREENERAKRASAAAPPDTVTVTIPAGVYAGQSFTLTVTKTGQTLQVTVPPGYGPGMPLVVRIPEVTPVVAAPVTATMVTATPVSSDLGRQMWNEAASSGSGGQQLLVIMDHVVNESDPQFSAHQIITVKQGDRVQLVGGTLTEGLPAPYGEYVDVRTSTGKVGKVSRFCVQAA